LNFNLGTSAADFDPLVMLVDSYGKTLLRFILSNDILIQETLNFARLWQRGTSRYGFGLLIVGDDLVADIDAFIANVNSGTGNQFFYFILRLASE
jgi:hypothetical protein